MTNPRLLILDEATEGLAPVIRAEIWSVLATLKAEKQSILVVDKNIDVLAPHGGQAQRDREGPHRLVRAMARCSIATGRK